VNLHAIRHAAFSFSGDGITLDFQTGGTLDEFIELFDGEWFFYPAADILLAVLGPDGQTRGQYDPGERDSRVLVQVPAEISGAVRSEGAVQDDEIRSELFDDGAAFVLAVGTFEFQGGGMGMVGEFAEPTVVTTYHQDTPALEMGQLIEITLFATGLAVESEVPEFLGDVAHLVAPVSLAPVGDTVLAIGPDAFGIGVEIPAVIVSWCDFIRAGILLRARQEGFHGIGRNAVVPARSAIRCYLTGLDPLEDSVGRD
jgi:hypothetical protein